MTRSISFLFLTAALLLGGSVLAQEAPSQPQPPSLVQFEVLKAELETTQAFQDRFISMVQWSMGTVIAIALGLAAFSWYSNKSIYERDREALRQEVDRLKEEARRLVKDEATIAAKNLQASLAAQAGELGKDLEKNIDAKLSGLSTRITEVNNAVLDVQAELTEQEAQEAFKDKRYSWALYKYCELLDIFVRRKTDYYLASDALDEISKILDIPELKLTADDVTTAFTTLKRLPAAHQAVAEKLMKRIKEA